MEVGLNGKTVVVTGAARGIGREICAGFASAGARLVGVDIDDCSATSDYLQTLPTRHSGSARKCKIYLVRLITEEKLQQ